MNITNLREYNGRIIMQCHTDNNLNMTELYDIIQHITIGNNTNESILLYVTDSTYNEIIKGDKFIHLKMDITDNLTRYYDDYINILILKYNKSDTVDCLNNMYKNLSKCYNIKYYIIEDIKILDDANILDMKYIAVTDSIIIIIGNKLKKKQYNEEFNNIEDIKILDYVDYCYIILLENSILRYLTLKQR